MTGNQISYWDYLRKEAADLETARRNREDEQIRRYATEVQKVYNQGLLAVQQAQNYETARHNREQEALTRAHNIAQERLASATLLLNYTLDSQKNRETERSNRAREAETQRYNSAQLSETARANAVRETQNQLNINVAQQRADYEPWRIALGAGQLLLTGLGLLKKTRVQVKNGGN